jgi:hypothetical protein
MNCIRIRLGISVIEVIGCGLDGLISIPCECG